MAHALRPPGYRFYPTDKELVSFIFPTNSKAGRDDLHHVIPVVNVYDHEPCQLPQEAARGILSNGFFFEPKLVKEVHGGRPSRTTTSGYWKATGSPTFVYSSNNKVIGLKKTMVFYQGKSSKGKKTK